MLCALAVGLASGVGLYALAIFSTAFLMVALGVIESFEKGVKRFALTIKAGDVVLRVSRNVHDLAWFATQEIGDLLGLPG